MKTYEVTIQATVRKTITVEAEDEQQAVDFAHEEFTVASTDEAESYNEEYLDIKEVTNANQN